MDSKDFLLKLNDYFKGEKNSAIVAICVGIFALLLASFLFKKGDSLKGMIYPLIIVALLEIGVGINIYRLSSNRIPELTALYTKDKEAFYQQEVPRMEKVMSDFRIYKYTWITILALSLAMAIIYRDNNLLFAICLGTILQFSFILVFDVFAEQRADDYLISIMQHLVSTPDVPVPTK